MNKQHLFLIFSLFLFTLPAIAQEYAVSVQHLTIENGLSNRFVNSIFQDSKGFIWIATNNGVNRWDGQKMEVFAEQQAVTAVMEDEEGRVWFQYSSRDDIFVSQADKFSILHAPPAEMDSLNASEWVVFAKMEGTILLKSLSDSLLYSYTDQLQVHPGISPFLKNKDPSAIVPVNSQQLWLVGGYELLLLDLEGNILEQHDSSGNWILKTGRMNESNLEYSTLNHLEQSGQNYTHYRHYQKKPGQSPELRSLFEEELVSGKTIPYQRPPFYKKTKNGFTWERKINQLRARDKNGKVVFDFYEYIGYTLPCPPFLLDLQDNAWIGTQNGVYRINISKSLFQSYLKDGNPTYSTRGIVLLEDSLLVHTYQGSRMVSITNGGLNLLQNTLSDVGIGVGIHLDSDSILYWGEGTRTTLSRYNLQTKKLEQFKLAGKNNTSYLPYRDQRSGTLWFSGTLQLSIFDEATKQIEFVHLDGSVQPTDIRHFYEEEKGLWLVARNGLFLVDPVTRKLLAHYSEENGSLPFNQFNYMHQDKDGSYWLATQGYGLLHWNAADGTYQSFARSAGFISPVIYAIYEDQNNRLWLPSEYGLILFDKTTNKTQIFLEQDGLSHNEFNGFSHYKDEAGRFYFGGLNGIIAFHPDSIFLENKQIEPALLLTSVEVTDNDKGGVIVDKTAEVNETNKLSLQFGNNSFTVQFAFLDYNSQPNIDYAYKIEGLDKDWTYQKANTIRLAGLPIGDFELRIKAKGNSGFWTDHQIRLPINVIKPVYFRWSFILFAITVVGLLFYYYFQYRTLLMERNARKLEKQVALRTQTIVQQKSDLEQLTQTKDRLYAIIAHDLRDPVESFKGIASKINYLLEKKDMNHVLKLSAFVESSAEELSKLLENLLQWARHQQKELPFRPAHHNVENLVKEVFGSLQIVATTKSIKLVYKGTPGLEIYGDYNMLTTVFRNFIDNALKFSHPDSSIHLSADIKNGQTIISLRDFGVGMDRAQLQKIFQIKKGQTSEGTAGERGTGLGMPLCKELLDTHQAEVKVKSIPGKGTVVRFVFLEGAVV